MRRCARCGADKQPSDFYRGRNADGLHSYCKACVASLNADRRAERRLDPDASEHDRGLARERTRRSARNLRLRVVAAYGGACACCGEGTEAFLALDHRLGDGASERKRLGMGRSNPDPLAFYRYVRDQGFPRDRYQLLCHNCNFAKASRGECPHIALRLEEAA